MLELDGDPRHPFVEHTERLLEQLLTGLVALQHDDLQRLPAGTIIILRHGGAI